MTSDTARLILGWWAAIAGTALGSMAVALGLGQAARALTIKLINRRHRRTTTERP